MRIDIGQHPLTFVKATINKKGRSITSKLWLKAKLNLVVIESIWGENG
jgi:hypothetical protein